MARRRQGVAQGDPVPAGQQRRAPRAGPLLERSRCRQTDAEQLFGRDRGARHEGVDLGRQVGGEGGGTVRAGQRLVGLGDERARQVQDDDAQGGRVDVDADGVAAARIELQHPARSPAPLAGGLPGLDDEAPAQEIANAVRDRLRGETRHPAQARARQPVAGMADGLQDDGSIEVPDSGEIAAASHCAPLAFPGPIRR